MSLLGSMRDLGLVARFEVLRALRTWQAVALVLLYVVGNVGGAYLFIEVLSEVENAVAAQLMLPTTRWPGALTEQLRDSEQMMRVIKSLVGSESRALELLDWPFLAVFQLWQGFVIIPFLAATAAADGIAGDVRTRAIRFEALRTGRAELVAGRFLGQAFLSLVATGIALVCVWCLGMALMVQQDPLELAAGLVLLGGRAVVFAVPFAGLGIAASSFTASPAWARVMAIMGVAGSWVLYGLARAVDEEPYATVGDALLPLLPQAWLEGLWAPGGDLLVSMVACGALGFAVMGLGYARFSRRDL